MDSPSNNLSLRPEPPDAADCPECAGRHWGFALVSSTVVHVCLLAVLGSLWISTPPQANTTDVDTRWTAVEEEVPLQQVVKTAPIQDIDRARQDVPAALLRSSSASADGPDRSSPSPALPRVRAIAAAWLGLGPSQIDVADRIDVAAPPPGDGAASVPGTGDSDGDGQGGAFFGIQAPGQRFIYLIDCSRSMNHPHASEAKTRFRRLKLELVKSVGGMQRDMQFFIIFFNDLTIPMPAGSFQSAVPDLQKRYLYWMQTIRADGNTEPTEALRVALQMRPDVVYFLTDGNFTVKVQQELLALERTGSTVHTFAFAEDLTPEMHDAVQLLRSEDRRKARKLLNPKEYRVATALVQSEDLLKQIAAKHSGQYHQIP